MHRLIRFTCSIAAEKIETEQVVRFCREKEN